MSNKTKIILAISAVVVLAGGLLGAYIYSQSNSQPLSTNVVETSTNPSQEDTPETSITEEESNNLDDVNGLPMIIDWNGDRYILKTNITTFLFMGIDNDKDVSSSLGDGMNGYASYMMLFILDRSTNSIDIIKIPDNLLTNVDIYDFDRNMLGTELLNLGSQYSYGDSNGRSNFLMKNKISSLLMGLNIDYCFSLTFDGIVDVVDSLETVDVILRNNWTDIDSSYDVDTVATLDSDGVMQFLTLRDSDENTNLAYLDRYDWFMLALFNSVVRQGSNDVDTLMDVAGDGLETDISADTVADLRDFDLDETRVLPDISDEDILLEFIVTHFYEPYVSN